MRRIGRWLSASLYFCSMALIPLASFGEEPAPSDLHDCGKRICEAWAPKDANTCRTCTIAQCRTQDGSELLVGQKKQSECYEGHDAPPADESPPTS